jgi:hypothetical protein
MPKPIQPPAPAYGSPEWKAERARMVGTPEWKAAHNYQQETSGHSGQSGGFIPASQFGVFTPAGQTLTTAQKQLQNPLYNPLYDPGSAEYKSNLEQMNQPRPRVQNPLVQPPNAPVATPQIPQLQQQPQTAVAPQQQSSPKITLPQQFQQNYNNAPGITPPANQGIKMPDISKQGFGGGNNWNDFLTVAYNRNSR